MSSHANLISELQFNADKHSRSAISAIESQAARIAELESQLAATKRDAARWDALANLWAASTILELRQDEDGGWSIHQIEPVENDRYGPLRGDNPDAAIDAAVAPGGEDPRGPTVEDARELGAKGAPPSENERLLFEAWMAGHCWGVAGEWNGTTYVAASEWIGVNDLRLLPGGQCPGFGAFDRCPYDRDHEAVRVGKKATGRLLDGREWNGVPA